MKKPSESYNKTKGGSMNYDTTDIAFYSKNLQTEGDYDLDAHIENGKVYRDFRLTDQYESPRQDAVNRIRTQKTDWRSHKWIGADLELFVGEPNTRKTGDAISKNIMQTLIYDNRFDALDVDTRSVPTAPYTIENYTMIETNDGDELVIKTPIEL